MNNKKFLTLAIIAAVIFLFFKNQAEAQSAASGKDVSWWDSLNSTVTDIGSSILGGSFNNPTGGASVPADSNKGSGGVACCSGASDVQVVQPAPTLNSGSGGGFIFGRSA